MQVRLFTVSITAAEEGVAKLNTFLNNNKILEYEKQLVQTPAGAYWCFYVGYESKSSSTYRNYNKIDYKAVLPAEVFRKFEQLRIIRRQIASEESVSAFVIATDVELSEIAKLESMTLAKLRKIKGFGEKKVEKYGHKILEAFKKM